MAKIIEDFISRYSKEYDYYQEVARLCAQQCENALERAGIRNIVTFRAKRPDRLRVKMVDRNKDKKYKAVEEIYSDIIDLAGVRIALYFPGDREEVKNLLNLILI
jgi:ppGpp synthetase/RelA/SpoT-type nucleotidyltranferase